MKMAITGGTGFVGRHLARAFTAGGHTVVLIARGADHRDESIRRLPDAEFIPIGTDDEDSLASAFAGCDGVAHCAGINREIGAQTYRRVHIQGTRNVIHAAQRAGIKKVIFLSFLRARPDCGSGYHESKWQAEEIVRNSGLDYTILKAGVIYGRGDHMLDHISHALETFPIFALVGLRDTRICPLAIEDLVRVMEASLLEGKRPLFFRAPIFFHCVLGYLLDRIMAIPLVSLAQVRILSEGIVDPAPPCEPLPVDLMPRIPFSEAQIRQGLPEKGRFGLKDLRWFA